MKKICLSIIMAAVICAVSLMSFACTTGGGIGGKKPSGNAQTLSLTLYSAGYGTGWIDEACRVFKKTHPNVEFELEASPLAIDAVKTRLENDNCESDIVMVYATDYAQFSAKGYLEELTDVYDSHIPGTETKLKDVILPQVLSARTINEKQYGIPWQANNASGLIYNKKMFRQYGWELPETMDEFWTLCDTIAADTDKKVSPIVYGGSDGFGYLPNNFSQWLCEYYGYDNMMEFLKLSSPAVFENQREGRDKIYKTIARFTKGVTASGTNIALDGSAGMQASSAQTNFMNGVAAMIPSGQYFNTEMKEYMNLKNFEAGFMPMPHINSDKKSGDHTIDTSKIRMSTDNGVFAIPASSQKKELAKEFLLSMFTSESYSTFVKSNNGLTRPVTGIEVDKTGFDDFTTSAFNYFNEGDDAGQTIYIISKNNLIEKFQLPIFLAEDGNFFPKITNSRDYDTALAYASGCVADEMKRVNAKYDPINQTF